MMPFPKLPGEDEIEQIMVDPQPGDRFHEMYAFWCYVLERDDDVITFITLSPPGTLPEDGEVQTLPLDKFRRYFSYSTGIGYWVEGAGRGHPVAGWIERGKTGLVHSAGLSRSLICQCSDCKKR